MTLQRYIKSLLGKYGLNQRRICERTGIDKAYISRSLQDGARFSFNPETLEKIVSAIGCDAGERLEMYRLAGKIPDEIHKAFCSSSEMAQKIQGLIGDLG